MRYGDSSASQVSVTLREVDIEPPRLRPSLLSMAAQCRLRFQRELGGRGGLRFSGANKRRRFLLGNLIDDAVVEAHRAAAEHGAALSSVLEAPVPEGLLAEERWLFQRALDNYLELAGDRPGQPILFDDTAFPRYRAEEHSSGRFALSVRLDPCFRLDDGVLEMRRLAFGAPFAALREDVAARVAALVLVRNQRLSEVRIAHFDLLRARVEEVSFQRADVVAIAREISDLVIDALDDPQPTATPDWWCHECPHLRTCPAVSTEQPGNVVFLATGEVS